MLRKKGFSVRPSKGTFYLYVKAPIGMENGIKFANAEAFSQYLIKEKMISVVPWDDAGAYIRFSLTFHAPRPEDEEAMMQKIEQRLEDCKFIFEEQEK